MSLENVKVGDDVVFGNYYSGGRNYYLVKVTRVTPTLIEIDTGKYSRKFKKSSGIQHPKNQGRGSNDYIYMVTDEKLKLVEATNRKRRVSKLKNFDFNKLSDSNPDLLDKVYNLVFDIEK